MRLHTADGPGRDPSRVIGTALDLGVTMIDTADAYQNEELVGRVIRDRRGEVQLASKFGLVWGDEFAAGFQVRADPAYVRHACEASLRRLGVDVIDLYYLHHRSDDVPIEETVGAMAALVDEGKVRSLGLSNVTVGDLRRASAVYRIAALQQEWSLVRRAVEEELVPTAAALGTTIVAHSPFGHGVLHGSDDGAHADLRAALADIARAHGVNGGQVALAWVHHREQVHDVPVLALPGSTRARHVRENVAAADLTLSDDELRHLDALTDTRNRTETR
ncbi:aldo/keto reductase [Georgenia halophila]|uniref:Aldo/keto reductase n=2 Tax=Georgenia halophila TaxID=620889 RepID=A0ABP8L565_9MICO